MEMKNMSHLKTLLEIERIYARRKETSNMGIRRFQVQDLWDERGSFTPVAVDSSYTNGIAQVNIAQSARGVIRGMHSQSPPNEQQKQLLVLEGTIDDVVLDPKTGNIFNFELNRGQGIIVPKGLFHGYETLSKHSTVMYLVDGIYAPSGERTINPMTLGYKWRTMNPVLSKKDREAVSWSDYSMNQPKGE